VPQQVIDNVNSYIKLNPGFRVVLANDADVIRYAETYPILIDLFQRATIASLKSDIARMVLLNEEGGAWVDCNTTLQDKKAIPKIFRGCEKFRFGFTVLPNERFDLKSSFMISEAKTELAEMIIEQMTKKLSEHYEYEKASANFVPYNLYIWVPPFVAHNLLGYQFDDEFRNFIKEMYSSQKFISPDLAGFKKYCCGLINTTGLLRFYGTNMEHHHGDNFHLHWSNIQKTQKLFF